jgi:hypothetical protein
MVSLLCYLRNFKVEYLNRWKKRYGRGSGGGASIIHSWAVQLSVDISLSYDL